MNQNSTFHKSAKNWFFFFLFVFIIIFLRWFLVAPLIFENRLSFILTVLFGCFFFLFAKTQKLKWLNWVVFFPSCFFLVVNCLWALFFLPSINDMAICNGAVYFTSNFSPFTDMQWTEYRYTKWHSPFRFETSFFGYEDGRYKIVCDKEKQETNIIRTLYPGDVLVYTDGSNPMSYDRWARISANNSLYFLTEECNNWKPYCESLTHRLVQCNLDYKSCHLLPIQYTEESSSFFYFEAEKDGINLIKGDNSEEEIIFTYGEHPRCYMEGCEILDP